MSEVVVAPTPSPPRKQRALLRDIVEVLVIALVLYFAISFAFQTIRVDGFSMIPTLQTQDLLLASKLSYHLHDPERGDIVVLIPPDAADANKDFIKRVIAVPGDVLKIDGRYVDPVKGGPPMAAILLKPGGQGPWQRLSEGYLPERWNGEGCCQGGGHAGLNSIGDVPSPLLIPSGRYFVLGDNRNSSKDSRFIGLVPRQNILSKAWIRLFPIHTFGFLGSGPTLVPAAGVPAALLPLVLPGRRRRSRRLIRRSPRRGARPRSSDVVRS